MALLSRISALVLLVLLCILEGTWSSTSPIIVSSSSPQSDTSVLDLDSTLAESTGYSDKDLELMRRALDQTPAEDRHLILKRVLRLGILSAVLATPALAASLIPLALVPLILISKHKVPPINVIPLPPPVQVQEPYYPPQQATYNPPPPPPATYNPPATYSAPPATYSAPPATYSAPAAPYSGPPPPPPQDAPPAPYNSS